MSLTFHAEGTFNLHHKLRARECTPSKPGAQVHRARLLYESVLPTHTVNSVAWPEEVHVKHFSADGRYLICFSRSLQDVVVYRFTGLTRCVRARHLETGVNIEGPGGVGGAEASASAATRAATSPVGPDAGGAGGDVAGAVLDDDASTHHPPAPRDGRPSDEGPADPATTSPRAASTPSGRFEDYFTLAYTRSLTIDADLLCKDFAVSVLGGDYVVLASSTPPEAAPPRGQNERNGNGHAAAAAVNAEEPGGAFGGFGGGGEAAAAAAAARADGAAALERARIRAEALEDGGVSSAAGATATMLPASPSMDTVALHLMRLADGKVTDRRVFRHDYVRLRRGAAVSTLHVSEDATLLTLLSLRWQVFHVMRVERRGAARPAQDPSVSDPGDLRGRPRRRLGTGLRDDDADVASDVHEEGGGEEVARFVELRTPVGSCCEADDDDPLVVQDRAEREWLARNQPNDAAPAADGDGGSRERSFDGESVDGAGGPRGGGGDGGSRGGGGGGGAGSKGWSDPASQMYTGIKQKLMTRILLEARRRDEVAVAAASAAAAAHAKRRLQSHGFRWHAPGAGGLVGGNGNYGIGASPLSRPPQPLPAKRLNPSAFTSAFFSRYWSYTEFMVTWSVQLLDERHVMLRLGKAEDVLAWGSRRGMVAQMGGERCPETMLSAVVDWVDGSIVHVGDGQGLGEGLLGVAPEAAAHAVEVSDAERSGGCPLSGAERDRLRASGAEGGWEFVPPPEGTTWQRLAAGAAGGGTPAGTPDVNPTARPARAARWPAAPHPQGYWNPSPYYDQRLFQFDARAASPDEHPRPAQEHSLKFSAARERARKVRERLDRLDEAKADDGLTNAAAAAASDDPYGIGKRRRSLKTMRFKLAPAAAAAAQNSTGLTHRQKRMMTHVFHPVYPFVISVSAAFMRPQVVSFQLRWEEH